MDKSGTVSSSITVVNKASTIPTTTDSVGPPPKNEVALLLASATEKVMYHNEVSEDSDVSEYSEDAPVSNPAMIAFGALLAIATLGLFGFLMNLVINNPHNRTS